MNSNAYPKSEESKYYLKAYRDSECAMTPELLLKYAAKAGGSLALYENPLLSALTEDMTGGTFFDGLKDSVTIPLLLCRNGFARAIVLNVPTMGAKKKLLQETAAEQHMQLYDFTEYLSVEALNRYCDACTRRKYLIKHLYPEPARDPEEFDFEAEYEPELYGQFFGNDEDCRSDPGYIYSPYTHSPGEDLPFDEYDYYDEDNDDYPFVTEEADPFYADEHYEAYLTKILESWGDSLADEFKDPRVYRFSTYPVSGLIKNLGIKEAPVKLLQNKRMIDIVGGKAVPTMFGRQCGVTNRLTLSGDGETLESELHVVTCAIPEFLRAVSYTRSIALEPDSGGRLADRVKRINACKPSSAATAKILLDKLRKQLNEGFSVKVSDIKRNMEKGGCDEEDIVMLFGGIQTDDSDTFRTMIQKLWKSHEKAALSWKVLTALGSCIASSGTRNPDFEYPRKPMSLEDRLNSLWADWQPIAEMHIHEYLKALAAESDSNYVLWRVYCELLVHHMNCLNIAQMTHVGNAVRRSRNNYDPDDHAEFMAALLLYPLAAVA